jgi:imidazoleglycerol-phosphate dehydratase
MSKSAPGVRFAEVDRETKETRIHVVLDLDGGTKQDITTGIGFFDHMLQQLAFHGQFDVGIEAEGDLFIDDHHTVEDVGIVLGQAVRQALESNTGIERYGVAVVPMDEALIQAVVDISGRGGFFTDIEFKREQVGELSTECVREFWKSFANNAGITLHIRRLAGDNDHHIIEGMFKSVGRALRAATTRVDRPGSTSTKGRID